MLGFPGMAIYKFKTIVGLNFFVPPFSITFDGNHIIKHLICRNPNTDQKVKKKIVVLTLWIDISTHITLKHINI